MKRLLSVILVSFCMLCSYGCTRIIPEKKMLLILEEMFVTDQWVRDNYQWKAASDTSWLYDPIFKKYGYTFKDYDATIKRYIEDSDAYSDLMEDLYKSVEKKKDALYLQARHDEILAAILASAKGYEPTEFKLIINPQDTVYELFGKVQLHSECAGDSLSHTGDSLERGQYELGRNIEEVLLSDGPHDVAPERHVKFRKKID